MMAEKISDLERVVQDMKEGNVTILQRLDDVLDKQEQACVECHATTDQTAIRRLIERIADLEENDRKKQDQIDALKREMQTLKYSCTHLDSPSKSSTDSIASNQAEERSISNFDDPSDINNILEHDNNIEEEIDSSVGDSIENAYTIPSSVEEIEHTFLASHETKEGDKATETSVKNILSEMCPPKDIGNTSKDPTTSNENVTSSENESTASAYTTIEQSAEGRKAKTPNFMQTKSKDRQGTKENKNPPVKHEAHKTLISVQRWWDICKEEVKAASSKTEEQYLDGNHTVLCVDISESMTDCWSKVKTFVCDYLNGIEKLAEDNFPKQNVALVTFGHETKTQVRLTKELDKIRTAFDSITLGGPTPLFGGILMAACATQSNKKRYNVDGEEIQKRVVLITDGHFSETGLFSGPDELDVSKQDETMSTLVDVVEHFPKCGLELICVPVGNANMELHEQLKALAYGEMYYHTEGAKLARRIYPTEDQIAFEKHIFGRIQTRSPTGSQHFQVLGGLEGILGVDGSLFDTGSSGDGVFGTGSSGDGVFGTGPSGDGVFGTGSSGDGDGVFGTGSSGDGVFGTGPSGNGVSGFDLSGMAAGLSGMAGLMEMTDQLRQLQGLMGSHSRVTVGQFRRHSHKDMHYFESNSSTLPKIGSRVCRGPDWAGNNQDGGGPGTVIGHDESDSKVCVEWDANENKYFYNYGGSGQYDVLLGTEPRTIGKRVGIAVGCVVVPGDSWRFDYRRVKQHEEGVVIRLNRKNRVQVKWARGCRGDYYYSPHERSELKLSPKSVRYP